MKSRSMFIDAVFRTYFLESMYPFFLQVINESLYFFDYFCLFYAMTLLFNKLVSLIITSSHHYIG